VFTPKGDLVNLPKDATSLDFAFEIHSEIGERCIGAKVNNKLVPLSHVLKNGDQIEVITSRKQSPREDWLRFVVTARAKSKIKNALKEEKRQIAEEGKVIFNKKLKELGIVANEKNIRVFEHFFHVVSPLDLYYRIAKETISLAELPEFEIKNGTIHFKTEAPEEQRQTLEDIVTQVRGSKDTLILGDGQVKLDYKLSPCCNPIPGDDVFGFITINEGIKIHRVSCPNAVQLMSNYAYRIVKARWKGEEMIEFLAGIRFSGYDEVGLVNKITNVISRNNNVNMKSISFETNDGLFDGRIYLFVADTNHLEKVMKELKEVSGVHAVERIDS
ncbi:MAG: TGS domain-containing protein, partial [Flavobacteriales bacterium]